MRPVVLAIGGSDPSGGAGVQGDLKTLHQHGVYGAAAITLLTVQSTRGVSRVDVMEAALVTEQVDAVLGDLDVRVIKTGALGSEAIVRGVAERVDRQLVCDPVLLASSGAELASEGALHAMVRELIPRATIVTPNAPEASVISGVDVSHVASARRAAEKIVSMGAKAALVKGGHLEGDRSIDVLAWEGGVEEIALPRITTRAGHGTGCALASSIAARLATGASLLDAVHGAKVWAHRAMQGAPGIGEGRGPLDLFASVD